MKSKGALNPPQNYGYDIARGGALNFKIATLNNYTQSATLLSP